MPRISQSLAIGVGAANALVDVSTYVDLAAGIQRSWGRESEFDDVRPGTFSFTLDNADGRFTPGNTTAALASGYSFSVTEGMSVSWLLGTRLVAGTVQSIEPNFPGAESAWAQVQITCDDMLGNAGRRELGVLVDSINTGATQFLMWPLDDVAGTVTPRELQGAGATLSLVGASGSAFGAPAIAGVSTGTQLTLKDSLAPAAAWPTFSFPYPTTTLGFYNFWITPSSGSSVAASVAISGLARTFQFGYTAGAYFVRDGDTGTPATYTSSDTGPHFVSMGLGSVFSAGNWTITATLYVDGVSRGSIVYGSSISTLTYRAPVSLTLTASV